MSEKKTEFSTILVSLDTLLDTRFATLFQLGEEIAEVNMFEGYHERLMDLFKGVDENSFKTKYENRDKNILKNSIVTPVIDIIKQFVFRTHENSINSPFEYIPKIVINIQPYNLEDDEIQNIIMGVRVHTKDSADIEVIKMSYEELTPKFLKDNISLMVLYDYPNWLETHTVNGNFKIQSCPEVGLIGPRLFFKRPNQNLKLEEDPFKEVEKLTEPFIQLVLLPSDQFSCVIRLKKKET